MKVKKEKKKIITENLIEKDSMKLFTMLSGYFLLVLLLFSLLQFVKLQNLCVIQILSITIPLVVYLLVNKEINLKRKIATIVFYLIILIIIPFTYNKTYDLTVDGNSYHKTAIAFIKNGWNPMYESMRSFQKNNNQVIEIDKNQRVDLWVEHYPKATWILAATIYNMTDNIESGKCITLIFSIMLLIISYNCLSKILDKKWSNIISIILVLNPIVLAQFFSYYVDGIMGILFTIELLLLIQVNPKEKINKSVWLSLVAICSIFVNLKFTGLLCSGVIAAVYYFYFLIANRKDKELFNIFKRLTIAFIIVFAPAIFIVGGNSYIKNTIDHHNPLYPLVGKDKVDIITTMQPKSFLKKNNFEKFIVSTFSKTENVTYENEPTTKLPIKVYQSEIGELFAPDVRIGGFGPLYALILIGTIILLIIETIIIIKKERQNIKYLLLPFLSIIISMILVGESWWARYVPQFYLLPVGTIILLIYLRKYYNNIVSKIITYGFICLIILNVGCFLYIDYKEVQSFKEISNDIKEMKNMKNLELKLGTNDLYGYLYTLNDNKVNYKLIEEISDEDRRFMYSWRVEVKIKNEKLSETN